MTTSVRRAHTRHITVVFGGGSSDAGLVRVLRSLVSESGADISGIFLEDQTLFRAAELPFITEVSRLTTVRRPLVVRELERQLRVQARRAERELRSVAESLGVPWSFRTHRGPLRTAIAQASRFDLLLLGAVRHALTGELSLVGWAGHQARSEWERPIGGLIDEADTGRQVVEAALDLARSTGRPLILFRSSDSRPADDDLRARIQALGPKRAAIHTVRDSTPGALLAAVRRASPAVLVVFAEAEGLKEDQIAMLRRELRCPVVLVRADQPSL